ncbi:MAG TPA: translation initiation factor IF-2 [Longimicrobiales bacterium]|nr:translation initiation factor IF-2 [Longimicrobiales bacterium]
MRVYEVAREFNVPAEALIQLLREMGVPVRSEASQVDDATVAKLRARFERERRAVQGDVEAALEAVLEDAHSSSRRRRRRRRVEVEEVVEVTEADSSASPTADAAEAMAAEAAEEAAARGAELVTTGGAEPQPEVIVVETETPAAVEAAVEAAAPEAEQPEPVEPEPEAPVEVAAEAEAAVEAEEAEEPTAAEEPEEAEQPSPAEPTPAAPPAPAAATPPPPPRVTETLPKVPRPTPVRPTPVRQAPSPAPAASAGPGGQVRIQAEGFTLDGRRKKDRRRKKRQRVDQEAVQENVQRVMAELKAGGRKRRHRREESPSRLEREAERQRRAAEEAKTVRVNEFLTVAELAELIDVSPTAIVASAFKNLGLMVTINQRLDFDQIELLLDEFGFRAIREEEYGAELVEEEEDRPEDLVPRPPVVTVMGHVDHGKTSLLDYIRKTNVIAGEAGGITQHIGAYHVTLDDGRSITFLDTPGHAAFTAMRARGAEITDIVVLVVAADDSVMPQTVEAISHAKNAGVPIVVAVNKVDLPAANPMRVRQELLQHGVMVEEFGGDVLSADVSAKYGQGMDDLLEKILLQAELLELKANPKRAAQGTVIEAQLDVGKGPVATVLVTNGTLRVGDSFVVGLYDGRVRAMLDERGKAVQEAGPGIPVQVLGLSGVPQAGDMLIAMDADRAAEIAQTRQRLEREKQLRIKSRGVKLTDIGKMLAEGEVTTLNIVLKGDVDGSVQALADALAQLSTAEVQVEVIHRGVGAINESDVLLAATAGAIIIGFHVRPDANARNLAAREGVDIRLYNIIYEAIEDVRAALEGMLAPEEREVLLGTAEVRQLFKVPRVGTVAGCYVTEGVIDRRGRVRVVRDGIQIYEGELASLKRFKDDVREVREGFECGLNIAGFNDIKVGDVIECYRVEAVARTLAGATDGES